MRNEGELEVLADCHAIFAGVCGFLKGTIEITKEEVLKDCEEMFDRVSDRMRRHEEEITKECEQAEENPPLDPLEELCEWGTAYFQAISDTFPNSLIDDIEKVKEYIVLISDDSAYQMAVLVHAAKEVHEEYLEDVREFEKTEAEMFRKQEEEEKLYGPGSDFAKKEAEAEAAYYALPPEKRKIPDDGTIPF